MSSPRGLVACGIVGIVVDAAARVAVGEDGDAGCGSSGRGNRKERGLTGSLERRGGLRTFGCMLRERNALFACGTYLGVVTIREIRRTLI